MVLALKLVVKASSERLALVLPTDAVGERRLDMYNVIRYAGILKQVYCVQF